MTTNPAPMSDERLYEIRRAVAHRENPMTNPTDIAAELERLAEKAHPTRWKEEADLFEAYRNHHPTILAALRAAGEVGRMREALEKIADKDTFFGSMPDIARRAIAGSET